MGQADRERAWRALMDEPEQQARRQAWGALRPAVLPPPERLAPENLLERLKAPYRLVAFTGVAPGALRDEVARALAGLAPAETRAWVLWGPGGIGKTRVAVEVARALEEKGWQAFFVPRAAEVPTWPEALRHWSRPERPTLLIVDGAEQRTGEELEALAGAAQAAAAERPSPLALLFLMRADPAAPVAWPVTGALQGADLRYEARRVPPLQTPAEREALFGQARQLFRERLAPPDAPPAVDYPPEALPQTPLALLALAVLAAFGHRVARSRDEAAVLTALWERWEQPRWRQTLLAQGGADLLRAPEIWAEARERIELALAAATLGRPFPSPEAVAAWWQAHYPFQARTARGETINPLWLARRLPSLFPAPEGAASWSLPPIAPDPLADLVLVRRGGALKELVASVLPGREEIPREAAPLRVLVWPIRMVAEVLPRLSETAVPGALEAVQAALGAAARWLKETIQALPPEAAADWLRAWAAALPPSDRAPALQPFRADFYQAWLERIPREEKVERARLLNNLGVALSALGRWEEALQAVQEAVAIRRQLAATNPQAFLPDLAMSLHNLGATLSALDRPEEALQTAQEAAGIYRQLAAADPRAFQPHLAASLHNLGAMLSELNRWEEALAAYEEGMRGLAPFFFQSPAVFAHWMSAMAWGYFEACRALDRLPDEELLGPIMARLIRVSQGGD